MVAFKFTESSIPAELSGCVKESVISIFGTMFGETPEYSGEDEVALGEGVVGIISYVGDITWMMMLVLPKASAQSLSLKFAGFEVDYDAPEMGDVVGELANVLAGDIVARLAKEDIKVAMSLPTILRGQDVEPLLPRGVPLEAVNFNMGSDRLVIKLAGAKEQFSRRPGN